MAEQAGPAVAAIRAAQAALADRHGAAAAADRAVAEVLQQAHAEAVAARRRIDAIAAQLEAGVQQGGFAVETALGAREFQRQLLARQHELIEIVEAAYRDATSKREFVESVRARYSRVADPS